MILRFKDGGDRLARSSAWKLAVLWRSEATLLLCSLDFQALLFLFSVRKTLIATMSPALGPEGEARTLKGALELLGRTLSQRNT